MNEKLTVLVSDRNPNVRELLKREMILEGHKVLIARNAKELENLLCKHKKVNVLILDPELAYVREVNIYEMISGCRSPVLLIIHLFPYHNNHKVFFDNALYVEKGENSIEQIKMEIDKFLKGPDHL